MNNRTMPAIDILLQPSRLMLGVLLLISTLACVCVIIVAIPLSIKLCLLAVIIFSTVYFVLRDALYTLPWAWQRVEVSSAGVLRLTNQQGHQWKPVLLPSSLIHPWVVILNTKEPANKWFNLPLPPVLIFPFAKQQHRHLRTWMKWWQHENN